MNFSLTKSISFITLAGILVTSTHISSLGAGGANKRKASWEEISPLLRIMPPRRAGPGRRYRVSSEALSDYRAKMTRLARDTDIIPAIAEKLSSLDPATEENEGKLTVLLMFLEEHPDPRLLPALDRVQGLKSPTAFHMRDEGTITPYDYSRRARKLAEQIRRNLASDSWERELKGLSDSERLELLTSFVWGIEPNDDEPKRQAAVELLRSVDSSRWWSRLAANLPTPSATDEVSKRKRRWMPYWIAIGIRAGKSHPAVDAFIRDASASEDIDLRQWAETMLAEQRR